MAPIASEPTTAGTFVQSSRSPVVGSISCPRDRLRAFPTRISEVLFKAFSRDGVPVARVIVDVMLKPEILDPQGRAVQGALGRLGLSGVQDVRQGKQFVIDLEGDVDSDRQALLEQLAGELLSNPVIENYRMQIVDDEATA